jgi:ribosome-associated toxin RatA of RatAB toxin-antitoxin module
MKHVKKSLLLWYTPLEMYELVANVRAYPDFLPWCSRAELLEEHDDGNTARLWLHYSGIQHAFTTRNRLVPGKSLTMDLIDGPFSHLDGNWAFVALGKPGGEPTQACKVEFDLAYAFSSKALETVVSPVFDRIANTFVDSFVKRAEQVYGAR